VKISVIRKAIYKYCSHTSANETVDCIQIRSDKSIFIETRNYYNIIMFFDEQMKSMKHAIALTASIIGYLYDIVDGRHFKMNTAYDEDKKEFYLPSDASLNSTWFQFGSTKYHIHRLDGPAITVYDKDMRIMSECHYFMGKPLPDNVPKILNGKIIPKCTLSEIINISLTFNREYAAALHKIYKKHMR